MLGPLLPSVSSSTWGHTFLFFHMMQKLLQYSRKISKLSLDTVYQGLDARVESHGKHRNVLDKLSRLCHLYHSITKEHLCQHLLCFQGSLLGLFPCVLLLPSCPKQQIILNVNLFINVLKLQKCRKLSKKLLQSSVSPAILRTIKCFKQCLEIPPNT